MIRPGRAGLQTWPINSELLWGEITISVVELARLAATRPSLPPGGISNAMLCRFPPHRCRVELPKTTNAGAPKASRAAPDPAHRPENDSVTGQPGEVALAQTPLALPGAYIQCSPRRQAALRQLLAGGGAKACKPRRVRIGSITTDEDGRNDPELAKAVQTAPQIPTRRQVDAGRQRRFVVRPGILTHQSGWLLSQQNRLWTATASVAGGPTSAVKLPICNQQSKVHGPLGTN